MLKRWAVWALVFFPFWDCALRLKWPALARGSDELLLLLLLGAVGPRAVAQALASIPKRVQGLTLMWLALFGLAWLAHPIDGSTTQDAFRVAFQPLLLVPLTMALLRGPSDRRHFSILLVAGATLVATLGLWQYAWGLESPRWSNRPWIPYFRVVSIFANPNALAAYLNLALAVCLVQPRRLAPGAAVLSLALLLTYSRGAWLALGVTCLALVWVVRPPRRWFGWALLLLALAAPLGFYSRLGELSAGQYYRSSAQFGRLAFWGQAMEASRAHPWLGVGPGRYGTVAFRHRVPGASWIDNHHLKLAAECGLPALAVWLALLLALAGRAWSLYRRGSPENRGPALAALAALLLVTLQSLTASVLEALYVSVAFWSVVGMLLALPEPSPEAI